MSGLRLVPVTRDQALAWISRVHRHSGRPQGYRFAVGVARGDELAGVAMAGRPVARLLDDGQTIEVTRVATDGTPHACSMLYGACWRAARALGYQRAITYTRQDEPGTSLRAAGWVRVASLPSRPGWDMPGRRRVRHEEPTERNRWEIGTVSAVASIRIDLATTLGDGQADLFEDLAAEFLLPSDR